MTEPREPEGGPDALDEAYRRASAADPSRPSEKTRAAILAHAREVAAARTRKDARVDGAREAANDRYWWRSAAASVALVALALMIWAPHFESGTPREPVVATATTPEARPPEAAAPAADAPPPRGFAAEADALRTNRAAAADARVARVAGEAKSAGAPKPAARDKAVPPAPAERSLLAAAPPPPVDSAAALANSGSAPAAETRTADAAPATRAASAAPAAGAHDEERQEVVVTGARRQKLAEAYAAAPAVQGLVSRPDALDAAIRRGDVERVRDLVARPGALEARDSAGRTPLVRAIDAGQLTVVRALLDAGADPNAADAAGTTPRAHAHGRADLEALLEERGGR